MDGILLIHKQQNMTSHDVVFKLRKLLHTKKIGHAGTLDPNATGVLVVLVGSATKAGPFLMGCDKEYIAELQLGMSTFTQDIWGEVLEEKDIQPITDVKGLLNGFLGEQKQLPPMISSIKVNGRKLYEYARANESVERTPRDINIKEIELLDEEKLQFRVVCTSGTYIRTLCVDIAETSGNLGCMKSLVRTRVGNFRLADCVTLDDVEAGNFKLYSLYDALSGVLPVVDTDKVKDVRNGKPLYVKHAEDTVCIVHEEEVLAVYERRSGDEFRCVRGLWKIEQ